MSRNRNEVYVLEDDDSIRELQLYALGSAGMEARGFSNAESFLRAAREKPPALALIDLMLPGGTDGLEAMKELRVFSPGTCVIIASAKGSEFDRITGLDSGADDYLVKPFSMLEMTSRVKAVLRRARADSDASVLTCGKIELDRVCHTVKVEGREVTLTRKEFAVLELLMSSPGRVFTRENLLGAVWGTNGTIETRTVDMHVAGLRTKLSDPDAVETVRGVGYRLGGGRRP